MMFLTLPLVLNGEWMGSMGDYFVSRSLQQTSFCNPTTQTGCGSTEFCNFYTAVCQPKRQPNNTCQFNFECGRNLYCSVANGDGGSDGRCVIALDYNVSCNATASQPGQCLSLYQCNNTNSVCALRLSQGQSCLYDRQCSEPFFCSTSQGGVSTGFCLPRLTPGARCTANNQCQSGACNGGLCTNVNQACYNDQNCCSNVNNNCPNFCYIPAGNPYGYCIAKLSTGSLCSANDQCVQGLCAAVSETITTKICQDCGTSNAAPKCANQTTQYCFQSNSGAYYCGRKFWAFFIGASRSVSGDCQNDQQCMAGSCYALNYQGQRFGACSGLAAGQQCVSDGACNEGLYCSSGSTCTTKMAVNIVNGQLTTPCNTDNACNSQQPSYPNTPTFCYLMANQTAPVASTGMWGFCGWKCNSGFYGPCPTGMYCPYPIMTAATTVSMDVLGNQPRACLPSVSIGGQCGSAVQCGPGAFCVNGVCQATSGCPTACTSASGTGCENCPCMVTQDCKSPLTCSSSRVCAQPTCRSRADCPTGFFCNITASQQQGLCLALLPDNSPCVMGMQSCITICNSATLRCGFSMANGPCRQNSDCFFGYTCYQQQYCQAQSEATSPPPPTALILPPSPPTPPPPPPPGVGVGSQCRLNSDCITFFCSNFVCAVCTNNNNCQTGFQCTNSICTPVPVPLWQACSATSQCQSGLLCDSVMRVCRAPSGIGGPCTSGTGCVSPLVCNPSSSSCAQSCSNGQSCPAGSGCVNGICQTNYFANGAGCSQNTQCASNRCFQNTCQPQQKLSQSCVNPSDCATQICQFNMCSGCGTGLFCPNGLTCTGPNTAGVCTPALGTGLLCYGQNSQCASQICQNNGCWPSCTASNTTSCETGMYCPCAVPGANCGGVTACLAQQLRGGFCSTNAMCISNNCQNSLCQ